MERDGGTSGEKMTERGEALSRRAFVLGAAAAASALPGVRAAAQPPPANAAATPPPEGGPLLIRGAHAVTMDPVLGDLRDADVLIADGRIRAIGPRLEAPADAFVIDGADCVVLPGFVDTHWHMWLNFMRGAILDGPEWGYFPLRQRIAAHVTPEDHYVSVLFGQAEALNAGITTVCNHAHGLRSPADADAELQAHLDSGGRAVFAHAAIPDRDHHAELERVLRERVSPDGRLGLMLMGAIDAANVRKARELGIMVTAHANQNAIVGPGREGLLGPDVQIVHLVGAWGGENEEGRRLVGMSGAKVSMAPFTAGVGPMGFPSILDLLADGVAFENLALSTDTSAQACADHFAAARHILYVARQSYAERNPGSAATPAAQYALTPRRALELATLGGARNLRLDREIGSLTPGKRADVITVRMDQLNMSAAANIDPTRVLVQGGQPANVDTVIVDGRLVKHGGRLLALDARAIAQRAAQAQNALQARAGLPPIDLEA